MADMELVVKKVIDSFYNYYTADKRITSLCGRVRDGTATFAEANEYSIRCGNLLAKAYKQSLDMEALDYDSALQLIQRPLLNNQSLIAKYCGGVQRNMNEKLGMQIKPVLPDPDMDRMMGLVKAISEAEPEDAISLFDEPIINYSQAVVDDSIRENASFYSDLGFRPQIIREYEGPHDERGQTVDCQYCLNLAGTYDYADVRGSGSEIYKRHEGCRCTLTFVPSKGGRTKMVSRGNAFIRE